LIGKADKQSLLKIRDHVSKTVCALTEADGLEYVDWWRARVVSGETNARLLTGISATPR
jgi:hypothetical protein